MQEKMTEEHMRLETDATEQLHNKQEGETHLKT